MAGIYIHIPFCRKKCIYCNFVSLASTRNRDAFANALCKEMELQKDYLDGEMVKTIYFGGGTPSILPADVISGMIQTARSLFKIEPNAEITLEANPDDISKPYCEDLIAAGINRLSLGVQSFFDDDLLYLGRSHSAEQARKALKIMTGFKQMEISADLIFGIPGLSDQKLEKNLQLLLDFGIKHISTYALTVEEKTPLAFLIGKGKTQAPDEKDMAIQFYLILDKLEQQGYEHYEISNYALPGHESRHNSAYWNNEKYLGLGPSAHSYDIASRQWNIASVSEYVNQIESGKVPFERENMDERSRFNEYVMTSLRTSNGIDLEKIKEDFGADKMKEVLHYIANCIETGEVERAGDHLKLTRDGKIFADRISSDLFWV
jgi:oxygen-independent coproporphyrinogen III oxidase